MPSTNREGKGQISFNCRRVTHLVVLNLDPIDSTLNELDVKRWRNNNNNHSSSSVHDIANYHISNAYYVRYNLCRRNFKRPESANTTGLTATTLIEQVLIKSSPTNDTTRCQIRLCIFSKYRYGTTQFRRRPLRICLRRKLLYLSQVLDEAFSPKGRLYY